MNLLDLIKDHKSCINDIIVKINDTSMVSTRDMISRATSSCRGWQLQYMILYVFNTYYSNPDDNLLEHLLINCQRKMLDAVDNQLEQYFANIQWIMNIYYARVDTPLYKLTSLNQAMYSLENGVKFIDNFEELPRPNESEAYKNYCMFISSNNTIAHYFTIIFAKGRYYMNSSYGSDEVCIPQFTTQLVIGEFNQFIASLKKDIIIRMPDDKTIISTFMNKYFLIGGLPIRYSPERIEDEGHPELKKKWNTPAEGGPREINHYTESENAFNVGWIAQYEELIFELISIAAAAAGAGGALRRKSTKKKTRRRWRGHANRKSAKQRRNTKKTTKNPTKKKNKK